MDAVWGWLVDFVVPRGTAPYTFPVAVAAAGLLAAGLAVLLRTRGRAAPLPGSETELPARPAGRGLTVLTRGLTLFLPPAALAAALVPGPPAAVWYSPRGEAADRPARTRFHRGIDAGPAVRTVLARLEAEQAAGWTSPDAEKTDAIAEAVKDVLSKPLPATAPAPPALPLWVTETAELTTLRLLAVRERAGWVGADTGPTAANRGWDAERAAYQALGVPFDLRAPAADAAPQVRAVWGARRTDGRLTFQALVFGPPGEVLFTVGGGRFPVPVPADGRAWRVLPVNLPAPTGDRVVAVPSGSSAAVADGSGSIAPPVLTVPAGWGQNAALSGPLEQAWRALLAAGSDLRAELEVRRGLTVPELRPAAVPATDGPNLWLEADRFVVLPAGASPPSLPAAAVPGSAHRTRVVRDRDGTPDSFTALDQAPGPAQVPTGGAVVLDAVRTDSPLADGRFVLGTLETTPVLSTAVADRRPAAAVHVAPARLRPGEDDPSRVRAVLAALVSAAQDAVAAPPPDAAGPDLTAPRGTCALSADELSTLSEQAAGPAVRVAVGIFAAHVTVLLLHTFLWRRPDRPSSAGEPA